MNINILILFVLFASIIEINSILIRSIDNAFFAPISTSNFTMTYNRSKDECLCLAVPYYTMVNYFENGTCQIFITIPCAYQVQLKTQVHLYLFNESVSLTPQSCAADLALLIKKLNNAVPNDRSVAKPRCLVIDDHGYLVTVRNMQSLLDRYDPNNLTLIDQTPLSTPYPFTITFHDGAYYIATYFGNITVVSSTTLTTINTISSSYINQPRDIIFVDNGYTMIVASSGNNLLLCFNRSDATSTSYTFAYMIPFSDNYPHGLWRVNDSFFYVTSYTSNTIFSYTLVNNTTWIPKLIVDARSMVSIGGGTHVTVDQHGRLWFSLGDAGVLIYDNQGVLLGSFSYSLVSVYDLLITDNYVIYLSLYSSNLLVRLDPNIDD